MLGEVLSASQASDNGEGGVADVQLVFCGKGEDKSEQRDQPQT